MYYKLIPLLFLLIITACSEPALDRKINPETALQDVKDIEAEEGELPRHHQKFLNSIAFIGDDASVDQTKIKELFNLFTDSSATYREVFNELEAKDQFEKKFTEEKLMPIYKQIDSLCLARQAILFLLLDGTQGQIDSIVKTGVDTGFMLYANSYLRNHYRYSTPEVLNGECGYIYKQDSLYIQHEALNEELSTELLNRFQLTTTYYHQLNKMFDVHQ